MIQTVGRNPAETLEKIERCFAAAATNGHRVNRINLGLFELRDMKALCGFGTDVPKTDERPKFKGVECHVTQLEDGIQVVCEQGK